MPIHDVWDYVLEHTEIVFPDDAGPDDVNVHFFTVHGRHDPDRDVLVQLISDNPKGEFATITGKRITEGPSYIEWGGWIGDQGIALRLLALGEIVGLWRVVTPERLGAPRDLWNDLAGSGFVLNSGLESDLGPEDILLFRELEQEAVDDA